MFMSKILFSGSDATTTTAAATESPPTATPATTTPITAATATAVAEPDSEVGAGSRSLGLFYKYNHPQCLRMQPKFELQIHAIRINVPLIHNAKSNRLSESDFVSATPDTRSTATENVR